MTGLIRDTDIDDLRERAVAIAALAMDQADEARRVRDQHRVQIDRLKEEVVQLRAERDAALADACTMASLLGGYDPTQAPPSPLLARVAALEAELAARPSSPSPGSATVPAAPAAPASEVSTPAAASPSATRDVQAAGQIFEANGVKVLVGDPATGKPRDTRPHVATRRDAHGRRWWGGTADGWSTSYDDAVLVTEANKPRGSRLVAVDDVPALLADDARKEAEKRGAADEQQAEREIEQLGARGGGDLENQIDAALEGVLP